jgi:hypothetical protein
MHLLNALMNALIFISSDARVNKTIDSYDYIRTRFVWPMILFCRVFVGLNTKRIKALIRTDIHAVF